jgi:dienelactone hydrolase
MYLCLFGLIICLSWAHSVEHPYTKKTGEVVWPEIAGRYFLTEEILEYEFENVTYEGYVAYPAVLKSMPGVLVAHQYMGLGEMEKFRAREAASFGNLAFALDYYGKANRPTNSSQAQARIAALRADPAKWHAIMLAGWAQLLALPRLNTSSIFAQGYCAGGQLVLELARLSTPHLVAVAAFHPALPALNGSYAGPLTAIVQVHHAQLDSAGDQGLLDFEAEMVARNVSQWTTLKYGNCLHGWTDPTSSVYRATEAYMAHATMRTEFRLLLGALDTDPPYCPDGFLVVICSFFALTTIIGTVAYCCEKKKRALLSHSSNGNGGVPTEEGLGLSTAGTKLI